MNFEELAKERRSAVKFIEGIQIDDADLNKIFELTKLSPSCFNLQHTNYVVVRDVERKERIRECAFGQYKIKTASAVIIVFGDKKAYQNVETIYSGMKMLKMIDECEYKEMIEQTNTLYEGKGERFQEDEAIRNASIHAMNFMFAAKHYGWDTCPMVGFDENAVHKELNAPDHMMPVLMIAIGKSDKNTIRQRGYRKPITEFVKQETF